MYILGNYPEDVIYRNRDLFTPVVMEPELPLWQRLAASLVQGECHMQAYAAATQETLAALEALGIAYTPHAGKPVYALTGEHAERVRCILYQRGIPGAWYIDGPEGGFTSEGVFLQESTACMKTLVMLTEEEKAAGKTLGEAAEEWKARIKAQALDLEITQEAYQNGEVIVLAIAYDAFTAAFPALMQSKTGYHRAWSNRREAKSAINGEEGWAQYRQAVSELSPEIARISDRLRERLNQTAQDMLNLLR